MPLGAEVSTGGTGTRNGVDVSSPIPFSDQRSPSSKCGFCQPLLRALWYPLQAVLQYGTGGEGSAGLTQDAVPSLEAAETHGSLAACSSHGWGLCRGLALPDAYKGRGTCKGPGLQSSRAEQCCAKPRASSLECCLAATACGSIYADKPVWQRVL